jgi:hypothetical protein
VTNTTTEFRVRRQDLRKTEVAHTFAEPAEGQVRFAIDAFALTSNNITYGAFGEAMKYWNFYPAPDGWGIIPVWGFATVVESRALGFAPGDRYYGYWPMASHAILTPGKQRPDSFSDIAEHRAGLASAYNGYTRAKAATDADDARYALFRGLYITSFLIDDYLPEVAPGITQVLLSSASSKTAIGLAQALKVRGGVKVVGLTSGANADFVMHTGVYDSVVSYEAIETLDPTVRSAFVDFAGNEATRARVHRHFGDALATSLMIGATDWDSPRGGSGDLPGPKPEMFFAPSVLAQRIAEWGPGGFDSRLTAAWESFLDSTEGWLEIVRDRGAVAAEKHYRDLLEGRASPKQGVILTLLGE